MNCRQGDLAFIINATGTVVKENVDRIVRVVEPFDYFPFEDVWLIRTQGADLVATSGEHSPDGLIRDCNLRPIRGEPERDAGEIRELQPRELESVAISTEHGVVLWPK